MERTLILAKPDAYARSLSGEILARFERKGLRAGRAARADDDPRAGRAPLRRALGKPFFGELVAFITSGPLVALVLEGPSAIPRRAR